MGASTNSQEAGESREVASSDNGVDGSPRAALNRAVSMGAHEILALTEIAESSSEFFPPRRQPTTGSARPTTNSQAPLDRTVSWGGTHNIVEIPENNNGESGADVGCPDEDEPSTTNDAAAPLSRAVSLSAHNILALTRNEESSSEFLLPGEVTPAPLHRSTLVAKQDANRESSDPLISDILDRSEAPANEKPRLDPLISSATILSHRSEASNAKTRISYMTEEMATEKTLTTDSDPITRQSSGETVSTTQQQSQRVVQSRPGAFRLAPRSADNAQNANGGNGALDSAHFTIDVEAANPTAELNVQTSQIADIEVVAAEEEDERIREQLRIEIMDEAIEAKVVKKRTSRSNILLLCFVAVLVIAGLGIGLGLGLGSSDDGDDGDDSQESSSAGDIDLESMQTLTASPSPTIAPSSSPTPTRCPCFSLQKILELRSSLPEGYLLDCEPFGSSSVGFSCRDANIDCGFRATIFCSGECDVFTQGIRACTVVEEDVGRVEDETVEVTEAEDLACRQIVNDVCSQR